jgi:hypothetical protein
VAQRVRGAACACGEREGLRGLTGSLYLVLEEFHSSLQTVGVSAVTGEGSDRRGLA